MNLKQKLIAAGAAVSGLVSTGMAFAVDASVPDASTQIGAIQTGQGNYSTAMFALALSAVGIMVGVKWIKRARGAA